VHGNANTIKTSSGRSTSKQIDKQKAVVVVARQNHSKEHQYQHQQLLHQEIEDNTYYYIIGNRKASRFVLLLPSQYKILQGWVNLLYCYTSPKKSLDFHSLSVTIFCVDTMSYYETQRKTYSLFCGWKKARPSPIIWNCGTAELLVELLIELPAETKGTCTHPPACLPHHHLHACCIVHPPTMPLDAHDVAYAYSLHKSAPSNLFLEVSNIPTMYSCKGKCMAFTRSQRFRKHQESFRAEHEGIL
jgi:hypothetical protein